MKFVLRLLLLAGVLFTCHYSVGVVKAAAGSANNDPVGSADATGASPVVPAKNTMLIRASSSGISAGTSVTKAITISMRAETLPQVIPVIATSGTTTKSATLTPNLQ